MRRLSAIGSCLALVMAGGNLPLSWAQDGAVLSVRAGRAVVDASALEDVEPGMKLGFVREDGGERTEIGQGEVVQVKDGKATIKLGPNGKVKKGDLVVVCPDPDDDPFAELRDVVDELQGQAKAQPRAPRSARIRTLTREAVSALEARDQAVADGKCDVAEHDERVSQAASQLAALSKSRESTRAEGRAASGADGPRGSRPASEAQEEEEPKAKPGTRETPQPQEPAREPTGTAPRTQSGTQTALDLLSRVVKALPAKRGTAEEEPVEGVEKDSVQSTVELIGKLADAVPKRKKRSRREAEAPLTARVEPAPVVDESVAQTPGASAPPRPVEPAEEKAAPPDERRPPRGDASPAEGRGGIRTSRVTPPATLEPRRQVQPLTLRGRVVNSKGEPVAGARVVSGEFSVVTNSEGFFRLANLKPGPHEISVTAPGFNPRHRTVSLETGRMPPVTFVLRREERP